MLLKLHKASLKILAIVMALLMSIHGSVFAEIELREFPNEEVRENYLQLIDELRCLVCQNQNLAASDAELANDLRDETFEMLLNGQSVADVKAFMVARYGEFVLYKPPFSPATWLIWIGPFVLLAAGLVIAVFITRRSSNTKIREISQTDSLRIDELLGK
ncbi:MAG TPA: cytochrome c-type biogenesis protein CcmH [Gammaproteobacteria bacterium]|jgi:cytochrome c-type biogenesis protein CcmH|nr:cytochrome c-type biogenesis protein CcmH [Gammaproteobacteria bacterium]